MWFCKKKRRKKMPKKGDTVLYVAMFDADASEHPNVCPAMVLNVYEDLTTVDLVVFVKDGTFYKRGVPMGDDQTRASWFPKP